MLKSATESTTEKRRSYLKTNLFKFLFFVIGIFCTGSCFGEGSPRFEPLAQSIEELLRMDTGRLRETTEKIYWARPSLAQRWGILNSSSEAAYNSLLKTIVISDDAYFQGNQGKTSTLKSLTDYSGPQTLPTVRIPSLFHELGHAEFHLLLPASQIVVDLEILHLVSNEWNQWLAQNHQQLWFWQRPIAISEIYGYYRGEVWEKILIDFYTILQFNGLFGDSSGCLLSGAVLNHISRSPSIEEASQLIDMNPIVTPYGSAFPRDVWVMGKPVSMFLDDASRHFKPEWRQALWRQFHQYHRPPRDRADLLARLNQSSYLRQRLVDCRGATWTKIHDHRE